MVRRAAAVARQHAMETAPQYLQAAAGGPGQPRHPATLRGKRNIERPAYPRNLKLFRDARDGVQHRRRQVRMLVRVQVGRMQTGRQNLTHLRRQLVIHAEAPRG